MKECEILVIFWLAEGGKTLGFVGNLIMWSILAVCCTLPCRLLVYMQLLFADDPAVESASFPLVSVFHGHTDLSPFPMYSC